MHYADLSPPDKRLQKELIKLVVSAEIGASANAQQNTIRDGWKADKTQKMEGMLGTSIDIVCQPSLESLEDIIFRVDDKIVNPEYAGQPLGTYLKELRLLGHSYEMVFDKIAALELNCVQAVFLSHVPMVKDVIVVDGLDDSLLDGIQGLQDGVGDASGESGP